MHKKLLFIFLLGMIFLFHSALAYDCKVSGCPNEYRCMGNGECTPLSIREYCEDHGKPLYTYDDFLLERNCSEIINEKEQKLCMQCKGDYELRKSVSDIEAIIFGIIAGIAILMLTFHGIRLVTARSPQDRENAKKAIMYVVLGIIIIAIATAFIKYLFA